MKAGALLALGYSLNAAVTGPKPSKSRKQCSMGGEAEVHKLK
jgi:hypothetical protein